MKGITAVIAMILLLLITIAVVGAAFTFFSGITSTASSAAQNQTSEQVSTISKQVRIDAHNTTSISIRSTGTGTMAGSEIAVFVDGAPRTCSPVLGTLVPGSLQTCNFSPACVNGQRIRVTAPGNNAEVLC